MKASKVIGSKFRHDNSSKKTLAYIGENLKMQKKVAYLNSNEYIKKRRKMFSDNIRAYEEALRQKRWEQIEQQEKLNKKNTLQKFKENTMDILYLAFGLLATPLIMLYDDIKEEFLGIK